MLISPSRFSPRHRAAALCLLLLPTATAAQAKDPVDYISPIIGTGRYGKTFPGAATPAGMVQLSPDTVTGGDNGSGYRSYHKTIQGFSFTHMSGVGWFGDLGNFLVMPATGPLKTWYGTTDKPGSGYLSAYAKPSETAAAGYYAVTLDDYGVRAEATAAPHSGILRFTFPENPQSRIQIDLAHRVGGTSLHQSVTVVDDHSIEGEIRCTPDGGGFGHGSGHADYTVFYHAEFSRPIVNCGVWSTTLPPGGKYRDIIDKPEFAEACAHAEVLPGCREKEGEHLGFYTEFPTRAGEIVLMKAGVSFVSVAGARANLAAEIPAWDFDATRLRARQAWDAVLARMSVEGGTEDQKTAFYTALYHAFIDPRACADLNGDYLGGDGQMHRAQGFTKRTVFSGWDVYRSEFPLLTLLAPGIVNDEINSQVELAAQNGKNVFNRWEFLNAYSGVMTGNPSVNVLNDAYQKGIRGFDVARAYACAVNTCERIGHNPLGYNPTSLSDNTEYSVSNWNLGRLADALGKTDDARKYQERALAYKKLFDPEVPWTYDAAGKDARPEWKGWFRPQDARGAWQPWLGLTSNKGVIEATLYQQGWSAPQDVPGLIALLGGRELFVAKLEDFFNRTPDMSTFNTAAGGNEVRNPYYNQPNEPVHLVPFLFNRAGAPWLTQKWIRKIDEVYKAGADGLCGDEDCGQMSAWFVLAASGLHQACPGDLRWEIFTPLFARVTLRLDPRYCAGESFVVTAHNQSAANVYIQSATLNGRPLNRCWLQHAEIAAGGTLDLVLGPQPNPHWGMGE